MKKRILAGLLCLVMLLSLMPTGVVAEQAQDTAEPHAHEDHANWTAWGDDPQEMGKLPKTSGQYFLCTDIVLSEAAGVQTAQDIVLCLNGKTVNAANTGRIYSLGSGVELTVCDCQAGTENGVYTAGRLTGATNTAIMFWKDQAEPSTLNLYDGIITENLISTSGAAVVIQGGGTFNMYGGQISGNEVGSNGAAFYVDSAALNMYGGTVHGNIAGNAGGAIYANHADIVLSGGSITGNSARHGAGLFVQGSSNVILNGVAITDNTGTVRGAGVDYTGNGTLTVGGTTKVTGNKVGEADNNLVLVNSRKLQLDGTMPLAAGAQIGISICTWTDNEADYTVSGTVLFGTNAAQEDAAQYFSLDTPGTDHYAVVKNGTLRFAVPKHEHPVEDYHTAGAEWTEWTDTNTLPTVSGFYYLAGDVNVTAANGTPVNSEQTIVLCLNGYSVTGKGRVYRLSKGANVTICDCTSHHNGEGELVSGKLIPGTSEGGVVALVADGSTVTTTLNLQDIIIDGTGRSNGNGGAIQLGCTGAVVNIDSCVIRNCTAASKGGAIQNHSGTLYITDTLITGNTANYGGALMLQNASKTTLTDVTITGNTAKIYGGGIDNELAVNGSGSLSVNGDTVIQDNYNTKAGKLSNVNLLNQTRRVTIGTLGQGASIGITAEYSQNSQDLGAVTVCEAAPADAAAYFTSDVGHDVVLEGQVLKIQPRAHTPHETDECGHESVGWTGVNTLPTEAGHYYLTGNVTVTSQNGVAYKSGAEVTVCLNGYSILGADKERLLRISNGTTVNICDCTGHGKLTGGNKAKGGVAWIGKDSSDTVGGILNLYGGSITGNTVTDAASGVIHIENGTFCMYGGQISGHDARAVRLNNGTFHLCGGRICDNTFGRQDGSAVRVENGTFLMTGGQITGNDNLTLGGTVRIDNGTATLTGGEISGNTAANAPGVLAAGGNVMLAGVRISGNTTGGSGGGLYIMKNATLTVDAGTQISGNSVSGTGGGGIYITDAPTVYLIGGQITDNTAAKRGGGVYCAGSGTLYVGGTVCITDNRAGDVTANLELAEQRTFALATLSQGAAIGVTADLTQLLKNGRLLIGTEAVQKDIAAYFTSDQGHSIQQLSDELYLVQDPETTHVLHTNDECGHKDVQWQAWTGSTALPTAEGHYYLTGDVTLGTALGTTYNSGAQITVCLNGFTVSGAGTGRIFRISNGTTVNVCDCTGHGKLTDGKNDKAGIAWVGKDETDTEGGTLKLYGGSVTGSEAGADSGLIHVQGGTFWMHGGEISGNNSRIVFVQAGAFHLCGGQIKDNVFGRKDGSVLRMADGEFTMTGGVISGNDNLTFGGTVRIDAGTATISGGKLTGNKASGGAAILMAGGKLTVTDAELTGNAAAGSGGAMYLMNDSQVVLGAGTRISGNTAGTNGGGIYSNTARLTLDGVSITGNQAVNEGGGIHLNGAEAAVTNTKITGNSAKSGGGMVSGKENKVTLTDSQITGNTASFAAGGLLIQSAGNVTVTNSKIADNKSDGNGGGVYISFQGTLAMKSGTVSGNTAKGNGGGIYMGDQMTLSGGSVTGNHAGKEGGGIYVTSSSRKTENGSTEISDGVLTMTGGSVSGNTTDSNGGGLCVRGEQGAFYMYGGSVSDNAALNTQSGTGHCGGVLVQGKGTFHMYGGTISGNAAASQGGGVRVTANSRFGMSGGTISRNTAYRGAGMFVECDFTVEDGLISENTAAFEGGGIYVSDCQFTLNGGTISHNTIADKDEDGKLDGSGGGVCVRQNARFIMNGGQIVGNSGKHAGGVVVQSKATWVMNDGLVAENTAQYNGGGLYNSNCEVTILGGVFRDNAADIAGGAIYTEKLLTVKNCEFTGNKVTASEGGTASGGAVKTGQGAVAVFENCKFTDNSILGRSGAIDVAYKSSVTLTGCVFTGNSASANGGAVTVYTAASLTAQNTVFNGNTSMGQGGAVYAMPVCQVSFTGCTFENNKGGSGGALNLSIGANAELTDCTVTGNTATRQAGAIYANGGVYLTDTVITGNTSNAFAVILDGSGSDGESFLSGTNQFKGDVIIRDNAGGDLQLVEGAFVNIHGDGLGANAQILLTQPTGGITRQIFGAYSYARSGDVYTLTQGDLALRQADPVTQTESVPEATDPTQPDTPTVDPGSAKQTVLIIFGSLLAVAAVLSVLAVLAVRRMKKKHSSKEA